MQLQWLLQIHKLAGGTSCLANMCRKHLQRQVASPSIRQSRRIWTIGSLWPIVLTE